MRIKMGYLAAYLMVMLASTSAFAAVSVSPSSVAPGQTITISGTYTIATTASGANLDFWLANASNSDLASATTKVNFTANTASSFSATMTIPSTLAAGSYYINSQVFGGSGSISPYVTNLVAVNVATVAKPTITSQSSNVTVNAGSAATFSVVASGSGLKYQWKIGTANIGGAYSATYTIPSTTAANAGSYYVVVSNSAGSVASKAVTLTVNAASTPVTVSPTSVSPGKTITISGTYTIATTASGASLDFWLANSSNSDLASAKTTVNFTANSPSSFSATMTIPSTLAAGSYFINSEVFNSSGSISPYVTNLVAVTVGASPAPSPTPSATPTPKPSPSPTPTSTPTPPPPVGSIKWNPGHYMASNGQMRSNDSTFTGDNSFVIDDLSALNNHNAIVGYRAFITWPVLEPVESVASDLSDYNFTVIDALIAKLKALNVPKHLVLVVMPGSFGGCRPSTSGDPYIPTYILSNSTYGSSPIAGSYGWGGSATGSCGSPYGAALWNANVMARWIRLHQALGKRYNSNPYFEAIMFQEDSMMWGAGASNGVNLDAATFIGDLENMLLQTRQYFPNTSIIEENTFVGSPVPTQAFEAWMIKNLIAPGTADTFGQTYIDQNHGDPNICYASGYYPKAVGQSNGWGFDAYFGLVDNFVQTTATPACKNETQDTLEVTGKSTDMRTLAQTVPAMVDVEAPDLGMYQDMGGTVGLGGYTPQDICNALNQTYNASHVFWTNLGNGSDIPTTSQWNNLVNTVTACPLTHTGYPTAYPK